MDDAVALFEAVQQTSDVSEALKAFDEIRRPVRDSSALPRKRASTGMSVWPRSWSRSRSILSTTF